MHIYTLCIELNDTCSKAGADICIEEIVSCIKHQYLFSNESVYVVEYDNIENEPLSIVALPKTD